MATTTGIRESGRENGCYVSVSSLADDGDETQTGFGFSVARRPELVRPRQGGRRCRRPGDPPARRDEAGEQAPDRRARPVRHGAVPRRDLLDAQRRERRQGPQPVPRAPRRAGRGEHRDARRRPDEPGRLHRHRRRRRGPGGPPQRPDRRRRAAAVRALQLLGPPGRHRLRPATPPAAGSPARPASAASPCSCSRAPATRRRSIADVDDGLLVQSVSGLHSGVNPISGDFSTGASGMLITQRHASAPRCAS